MTRLTLIVLVFAVLVLSVLTILFITTRKQKYLEAIKKVINYSLNGTYNRKQFIEELTDNLPPPPAYFPANVKLNQEGYDDLDIVIKKSLKKINPNQYKELIDDENVIILDTRDSVCFTKYHLPKSIFIGLNIFASLYV